MEGGGGGGEEDAIAGSVWGETDIGDDDVENKYERDAGKRGHAASESGNGTRGWDPSSEGPTPRLSLVSALISHRHALSSRSLDRPCVAWRGVPATQNTCCSSFISPALHTHVICSVQRAESLPDARQRRTPPGVPAPPP